MSAQRALGICRSGRSNPIIGLAPPSRARELVESGMLDRAAKIAELAHGLTDAAFSAMEGDWSRRRADPRGAPLPDLSSLRSAAFEAIAFGIIDRIEGRRP